MLEWFGKARRWLEKIFGRSEWAARQVRRSVGDGNDFGINSPGVLLLQIDGLAYDHLLYAIEKRKLPFLQRLIQRDHFVLRPFYSGLPSATPAVQAELFYGVKSIIPAFKYYDRLEHREKVMFDAQAVNELARELESSGRGLLQGGSSYSNIFAGGAEEALFCIQSMKLESIFHDFKLRKVAWFILINLEKVVRIFVLSLLEAGLACYDCVKGIFQRRNPLKELKFVFSRVGTCIVLRELIRLHVKIDIVRGLRVIHANFLGYDEHSHRRGPRSLFALWTLKGIDATIKDLVYKAVRSGKRDYQVIIYSDHGQEHTRPFVEKTGKTLREAVAGVFSTGSLMDYQLSEPNSLWPHFDHHQVKSSFLYKSGKQQPPQPRPHNRERIHITAMGPLGHIYLPEQPEKKDLYDYARRLVAEAGIPLVLFTDERQVIAAWSGGIGPLKDNRITVFGGNHPFLNEVAEDMELVCRHRNAGNFVISGWQPEGGSLTFPIENGSHGGPGSIETRGFAIIPEHLCEPSARYLRPADLRRTVFTVLEPCRPKAITAGNTTLPELFRAMTYNIHSCRGLDGKIFPERIARIIERLSPDLVALQEVDRNLERSGGQDQARILGELLNLNSTFMPLCRYHGGQYGLAILSRPPFTAQKFEQLPRLRADKTTERRGIMQVSVASCHGTIHLFNTHLSLIRRERLQQMRHILEGPLGNERIANEAVIFCGDLNGSVNWPVYRLLLGRLLDSQNCYPDLPPEPTFFAPYPTLRLDHIFHSALLKPIRIGVVNDWECRLASDHLPVIATFSYNPEALGKEG